MLGVLRTDFHWDCENSDVMRIIKIYIYIYKIVRMSRGSIKKKKRVNYGKGISSIEDSRKITGE